ncbi:MAG: hypothetical protein H0W08_18540, partial [Acidobacteria bacterium]|nr:hypothetical protein [Acidobacteriota bacterium]
MLDASILALLAVVVLIVVTGGGVIEVAGMRVRARTVENPIWILAAAITLRYATRFWSPFLCIKRWPVEALIAAGLRLVVDWIPVRATGVFRRPWLGLAVVGCVAFLLKVFLASTSPGFFSGDDVEIHEMSMGVLLGTHWSVWDLRSAFFPMVFIYPAQRVALAFGGSGPDTLVLAGRVMVAFISTAVIPLTWLAARRLAPADPRLAALAVLFVTLNKLHISFGSSELPRPVSSVFVAAAFLCILLDRRLLTSAAAGTLLGTAAAFRFSEALFVPAAILTLGRKRFSARAAILLLTTALAVVGISAAADAWYWGSPMSSVAAAIDYTLVQRQSSRGYEPPWEYLWIIPAWSTFLFVALAIGGSARRHPDSWWLWVPIALLSLLPHKESRYLIPMMPFLSIASARGFLRAVAWIRASADAPGWRRWSRELFAPVLLLSVLHDMGGWRLVRSNEGVRLAQYLRASGSSGIAVQDLWRLGGRPYLSQHQPLVEVSPELLTDTGAAAAAVAETKWVALRARTARIVGDSVLPSLGFERDDSWRGEDYVLYVRRAQRMH